MCLVLSAAIKSTISGIKMCSPEMCRIMILHNEIDARYSDVNSTQTEILFFDINSKNSLKHLRNVYGVGLKIVFDVAPAFLVILSFYFVLFTRHSFAICTICISNNAWEFSLLHSYIRTARRGC